eukprot:5157796-Ditylum_brightwellii.AAC.1
MELKLHSWMQEEKRSTGVMLQQTLSENTIVLYTQPFLWYGTHSSIHQLIPWGCVLYPHMTIKLLPLDTQKHIILASQTATLFWN